MPAKALGAGEGPACEDRTWANSSQHAPATRAAATNTGHICKPARLGAGFEERRDDFELAFGICHPGKYGMLSNGLSIMLRYAPRPNATSSTRYTCPFIVERIATMPSGTSGVCHISTRACGSPVPNPT